MEAKFSQRVKDVLAYSREEALRLGNNYIGIEHLLLGIIREGEGKAVQILSYFGIDLVNLRLAIENSVQERNPKETDGNNIPLVKQAERALKITYLEAKTFNSELIGTEHLLLAILKDNNNLATKTIQTHGIDYNTVKEEFKSIISEGTAGFDFNPKDELPGDTDDMEDINL